MSTFKNDGSGQMRSDVTKVMFEGMNAMRSVLGCLALGTTLAAVPAMAQDRSNCDAGEQELKFSIVTAVEGHPKGEAALAFGDDISRKFDGRFCVVVYGNASLYDDNDDLFNAMRAGEVAFAAPSLAKLDQFSDKLIMFSLPFLFDGPLHALEFMNSDLADAVYKDFEDDGFYAFGFWSNDMRQMVATRALPNVRDGEGLMFRVENTLPITLAIYNTMGIDVVQLPFSKVNEAFESGEIQGVEQPWSNIESRKFYTYDTIVTETNHNYLGYMTMASQTFLNSLSEEDRQTIIDSMRLITHERNRFAYEINQQSREYIIEDGGKIVQLTPEQLQAYREAFKPTFDEYRNVIGAELIDQIIELNANTDPFD